MKSALVTGGTKGIGRAIAESLIKTGARVAITARHEDEIAQAVSQLNAIGPGTATGHVCDVRDYNQVKSVFARLDSLDILVNNAGVGIFGSVEAMSVEDFRTVLETNVFGVFYFCHEAIPLMKKRGGGYIINISSLAGANPHPEMAAYNASKFGLTGFTEAMLQDVRSENVRVSTIMPGSVATEFSGRASADGADWKIWPEDVAKIVQTLLTLPARTLVSRVEVRPAKPKS